MIEDRDLYQAYHAAKLWALLPELYRAEDTDSLDRDGPLRELVGRIGLQAAVLRRSIDRMWDDQSIETCDDWVVPYIGGLLATNLVAGLPPREQRLDVANTIYFRRRKGTLAVLEEVATAITGWEAKLVEFFRRLGRTRHLLDPPLPVPAVPGDQTDQLLIAQRLVGPRTRTGAGGFADLRNAYGAAASRTAFDEFASTADFRLGRGAVGWHDIPRLGVFLWRLQSFGGQRTTPVQVHGCAEAFTFDPTGRDVPLFARAAREAAGLARNWVSPEEWQLPGPIAQALYDSDTVVMPDRPAPRRHLYPGSLAVYDTADRLVPPERLDVDTPRGRVRVRGSFPMPVAIVVSFHGFASRLGAGMYDRRVLGTPPVPTPLPLTVIGTGAAIPPLPAVGTLRINDSLTRESVPDGSGLADLTMAAGIRQRPLIRLAPPMPSFPSFPSFPSPPAYAGPSAAWALEGAPGARLALDGLFVSGGDIVLRGDFRSVTLTCCTLDPGSAGHPPALFALSADARPLVPARLWIEGTIATLTLDRCIAGPIRTRGRGAVETLAVADSIVQAIPTRAGGLLAPEDVQDPERLIRRIGQAAEPVAALLAARLSPATRGLLGGSFPAPSGQVLRALLDDLNALIAGPSLYDPVRFAAVSQRPATRARLRAAAGQPDPVLNRMLLEDAFPIELADAALALADGKVMLHRCTVLGATVVHRLDASECILADIATVDDLQEGCVRFSAITDGSLVPLPYESVDILPGAALFTSTDFGQPGFAQLLPQADTAILPVASGAAPTVPTILRGAHNGSEMGAFARDGNPIRERGLMIKLQEFMPTGLVPVLVYVT